MKKISTDYRAELQLEYDDISPRIAKHTDEQSLRISIQNDIWDEEMDGGPELNFDELENEIDRRVAKLKAGV